MYTPQIVKVDLHLHSKYSWDSKTQIESYVQRAEEENFGAIAIADHNDCRSHAHIERIQGETEILLIPAQEVSTKDGHLLVYGWIDSLTTGIPMRETVLEAKDAGALLTIAAHPYDLLRKGKGNRVLETGIDGIEVLNASMLIGYFNWLGKRAVERTSLFGVGNSDSHRCSEFGMAYTEIKAATSIEDVLLNLRDGVPRGRRLGVMRKSKRFLQRKFGRIPED